MTKKKLSARMLAELRKYAESLKNRGSPYAVCNHETFIAIIDNIAALEAEISKLQQDAIDGSSRAATI